MNTIQNAKKPVFEVMPKQEGIFDWTDLPLEEVLSGIIQVRNRMFQSVLNCTKQRTLLRYLSNCLIDVINRI